ncbi:FlgD immunoglobulin-like domain containing protein [Rufibacter psychrotolerans]|uniref:FlgD immunoglobulin-like domain containing protein n=1 Tax=Rufibacter psychrotolerans TaxID=2812556 RepID=UPI001968180B|nr:FlgD immunoglobulin-like domain containing protein [Rufibacter sp. SYSU D00308]
MTHQHRRRQFWYSGALLLLFGAFLYLATLLPAGKNPSSHFSAAGLKEAGRVARAERLHKKGAIGTKEKPAARADYEFDRLRDPATGTIPAGIRELELAYASTLPSVEQVERIKQPYGLLATSAWSRRGPYNVGGRTRALALDVANENHILAGGVSGGLWRSTNGGTSWTKVTDPGQLHSVTTIAQDQRAGKRNIWYYGTGEILGNSASKLGASYMGNGIFKSIDNGVTWNPLPRTQTSTTTTFNNVFQYVYRVATAPSAQQDEVYAATPSAIWRSANGGDTWAIVLGGGASKYGTSSYYTDIEVSPSGVKYAGMSQYATGATNNADQKGAFRSLNGIDWVNITPATWPTTYRRIVMDVAPSNENIVYFFLYTDENPTAKANIWKYEYLSGDGSGTGGVWTNLSANLPMLGGRSGDLDLQGGYNMVIRVKPDNPNVVVLGGTNLYLSPNGFTSTTGTRKIGGYTPSHANYALYPNHHPDQHEFVYYPSNPSKTLSGHDGGVSRTGNVLADSVKWESLNRGYQTTQFYTVAMDLNTEDDFVVGGMQDNGTWSVGDIDATTLWNEELGGDGSFTAVTTHSLFVSSQNGTVYRFIFNDAGNYVTYARIDPPKAKGYLFINPYSIDPNNEYTVYIPAGDSLWRNKNVRVLPTGGTHSAAGWEVIADLEDVETISSVAVSKVPANVLYFGTRNGKLYKIQNASVTGMPVRTDITGTNFPANANIGCIAIDPRDANKVVVTFTNYRVESLFYTTNGGTSWTAVSGNLEENGNATTGNGPSTRWVTILPEQGGGAKYFVGTSTGLYSTANLQGSATTWIQEGASFIGNVPVDMVISRTTDNLVLVGTHGNGVYSRRYNGPLASKEEIANASKPGLQPGYPNPFRQGGTTTIPFALAKAASVRLVVYDLAGKEVATLVNGKKQAGQHQVTWDGRNHAGHWMPSATYLYQLTVDGKRYTGRTVFLR